ncbi:hypothetical protein [Escherichia coli]|uniref:hypothetical protein n=1 Tax=Escherichia coli TaxID=562 RepID=UPI00201B2B91|nr:hypothetical protein [Escherichia coli]
MIKAEHAGDTCSAFSDVVNFVVGRTQDFAGSAVVVDVPGVRKNDSEHFYTSVVSTHRKERSLNFHFTLFNNKQST